MNGILIMQLKLHVSGGERVPPSAGHRGIADVRRPPRGLPPLLGPPQASHAAARHLREGSAWRARRPRAGLSPRRPVDVGRSNWPICDPLFRAPDVLEVHQTSVGCRRQAAKPGPSCRSCRPSEARRRRLGRAPGPSEEGSTGPDCHRSKGQSGRGRHGGPRR